MHCRDHAYSEHASYVGGGQTVMVRSLSVTNKQIHSLSHSQTYRHSTLYIGTDLLKILRSHVSLIPRINMSYEKKFDLNITTIVLKFLKWSGYRSQCGYGGVNKLKNEKQLALIVCNGQFRQHIRGLDPGGWGCWEPNPQGMFWPPKMSHSFIQNCCWITLQVSHHQRWKTCVKNGRQN